MSAKRIDESEFSGSLAALFSALAAEDVVIVERDSTPIAILKALPAPERPATFDLDAGGGQETVVFGRRPFSRPT